MVSGLKTIDVLGVPCRVLVHPTPIEVAHPGEAWMGGEASCRQCAVVAHPALSGERVLVWILKTGDATISRADPAYERHRTEWPRWVKLAKGGARPTTTAEEYDQLRLAWRELAYELWESPPGRALMRFLRWVGVA